MVVLLPLVKGSAEDQAREVVQRLPRRARQGRQRDRLRAALRGRAAPAGARTRSAARYLAGDGTGEVVAVSDAEVDGDPAQRGGGRLARRRATPSSPSSTPTARTSAASPRLTAPLESRRPGAWVKIHSYSPVACLASRGAGRAEKGRPRGLRCGTISAMRGSAVERGGVNGDQRDVDEVGLRLQRGQQGPEGPARRQGRQPRRDDQPGPARPARLHDHHRRLPLLPGARRHARRSSTPRSASTWPRSRRPWARPSATRPTRCWCRCARAPRRRCPG